MGFAMKTPEKMSNSARETINRLREKNKANYKENSSISDVKNEVNSEKERGRQRASGTSKSMSAIERNSARHNIMKLLLLGEITQGQALKTLRVDVLGLKQENYATLVSVSRKTLSEIENDRGNYTSDIINKVFKPFGLQVGLVPISRHTLSTLLNE
ncbi:transcriptional regulator, y4mF family [Serratia quinivorans]|nr:transcriptional regulator, y4mF family [Serratia quinivorans]